MNQKKIIEDIQKVLKYKFKNENNLINCLIHPSYKDLTKKNVNLANEFERLEF